MQKWNPAKRQYEPYTPPEGKICIHEADLESLVNCAGCGKELRYGSSYTSRFIHNDYGIGYAVCWRCYEAELDEELRQRGVSV